MVEGLFFGAITYLSLLLSWRQLPRPIKSITKKHPFLSDVAATGLTFMLLTSISKSIIAVIGAVVCGLLVNFSFLGVELYERNNTKRTHSRN